jgi:hypothetical protein
MKMKVGIKSIAVSTNYVTTKGQVYLSKKYGVNNV